MNDYSSRFRQQHGHHGLDEDDKHDNLFTSFFAVDQLIITSNNSYFLVRIFAACWNKIQ